METIGPLESGYFNPHKQTKKKVDKKEKTKKSFKTVMSETTLEGPGLSGINISSIEDLSLEELLDEVHQAGDKLKNSPTMTAVLQYKQAVKGFIHHVVEQGLELVEQEGVKFANPMKKQKKYTIIKVIDQKLEKLAAGIMQNQKSQLEMLEAVNEIHGLLVDLLQ
ncbi:MAG: YaaR family protein [Spirochaetales bacterium]|nr:YaaR family protein [Spirochaetales bacterium]